MDVERRNRGIYWDRAWKLVEGCSKVSDACDHCWSEAETVHRTNHPNDAIRGRAMAVTHDAGRGRRFNGRILCREDNLTLPVRHKIPTVFAVWNDLFHEDVPLDFIMDAYDQMYIARHHTFLVLTKRAARLADFFDMVAAVGAPSLKNVWHGVTAEDQRTACERIRHLLRVPGKKFVSCEPLLGPVDILKAVRGGLPSYLTVGPVPSRPMTDNIHAVIGGGESGPQARPCNPEWARALRDQCRDAGTPFYWKQNGEFASVSEVEGPGRAHYFPSGATVRRMARVKAGRTIDGRQYDFLPWDSLSGRFNGFEFDTTVGPAGVMPYEGR